MNKELYVYILLGIILVSIIAIYFLSNNKKMKAMIVKYILEAEKKFLGSEQGKIKKEWVINTVYQYLPTTFRIFVSQKMIGDSLEFLFKKVENVLINEMERNSDVTINEIGEEMERVLINH